MATQKTITNPIDVTQTLTEYGWMCLFQTRFDTQDLRMDCLNFAGKAAYVAGSPPIGSKSVIIPKDGLPALDDQLRPLFKKPDNTYVLATEKDNPDALAVVPTYAEVPPMMTFLLSIAAPAGGLPEGTPIFGFLMAYFYNFIVTRPEFAGCTVVDI